MTKCNIVISTEGALRRPMTYDPKTKLQNEIKSLKMLSDQFQ